MLDLALIGIIAMLLVAAAIGGVWCAASLINDWIGHD